MTVNDNLKVAVVAKGYGTVFVIFHPNANLVSAPRFNHFEIGFGGIIDVDDIVSGAVEDKTERPGHTNGFRLKTRRKT